MNKVAGRMKSDLAQFRELAAFAQFASDLDTATRNQLERGARLTELLKQDKYQPIPVGAQVAIIYAGTQGQLDKVPIDRVREWKDGFIRFLNQNQRTTWRRSSAKRSGTTRPRSGVRSTDPELQRRGGLRGRQASRSRPTAAAS